MARTKCVLFALASLLAGRHHFFIAAFPVHSPRRRTSPGLHARSADELTPQRLDRRRALRTLSQALLPFAAAAAQPRPAAASDLFRANPLTNPALERLRIWNQEAADNLNYGGELAAAGHAASAFDQYVDLLRPILAVEGELVAVDRLLAGDTPAGDVECASLLARLDATLSQALFDRGSFKKAFNAFADNIYYSDPDRANLYLGGGAVPRTTQSLAYLLRNDVLGAVEDMQAEVRYLTKELKKKGDGGTASAREGVLGDPGMDLEELRRLSRKANEGMAKYLDLVPPKELEAARGRFSQ